MQIQRIQTLWLIIAFGCILAFILLPFGALASPADGGIADVEFHSWDFVGLIIPAALAALLDVISIFCYRNLSLQRRVTYISLMMLIVSTCITLYILCAGDTRWQFAVAFLPAAALFDVLALSGISHDSKLLKSYDRIR